ncbi:MAG: TolC family protein [Alphaproteobacteria bacterium]|nr:TolC family protein [Alphaproteobacteria bacterium]
MKHRRLAVLGLLLGVSTLSACATPHAMTAAELRDSLPIPDEFPVGGESGEPLETAPWRAFFDEPILAGYIVEALSKNQELNILLQEIEVERAEVGARTGELFPVVRLRAAAEGEKVGAFTRAGAVEENLEIREGEEFPKFLPDYVVGAELSWEVDIWKKLRNARKAQVLRYLASQEGRRFMVTRLVAEIAQTYYELEALDARLDILGQTIELQKAALETVRLQKAAARSTELAVRRFEAEVLGNESERFTLQQEIVETENRLRLLLGGHDGDIVRSESEFRTIPVRCIRIARPDELLAARPDIRQAELQLKAADLDVKVARAQFLPQLDVDAVVGLQSFQTSSLAMTPESLIYRLAANLAAPLVNRSAVKAAFRSATARQLQALYDYQQTVLEAYTEVATLLVSARNLELGLERKVRQVEAFEASVEAANRLFASARAEYTEVLLTQREALDAEIELIDIKQRQLATMIGAYRAVGGGAIAPGDLAM